MVGVFSNSRDKRIALIKILNLFFYIVIMHGTKTVIIVRAIAIKPGPTEASD
jgi:hypothetical protein